jgi:hypothetical protein
MSSAPQRFAGSAALLGNRRPAARIVSKIVKT